MHPVQEQVNTLGIDCSIQRANWIYFWYERNSFPTQSVTITLRQHKSTPAQQVPRQKNRGMCQRRTRITYHQHGYLPILKPLCHPNVTFLQLILMISLSLGLSLTHPILCFSISMLFRFISIASSASLILVIRSLFSTGSFLARILWNVLAERLVERPVIRPGDLGEVIACGDIIWDDTDDGDVTGLDILRLGKLGSEINRKIIKNLKEQLHLKPKLSMSCELWSQNY